MRILLSTILTLTFTASAALAMSDMSSMPGMTMGSMKPAKCPSSDPAVIVNTSKMTYMMDTKKNRGMMKGMMSHDKFVCKSQAEKMGAKMISGPMTMKKM